MKKKSPTSKTVKAQPTKAKILASKESKIIKVPKTPLVVKTGPPKKRCSDGRLKTDITPLNNIIEKVKKINGMNYYFKQDGFSDSSFDNKKQIGFIGQELELVFPEVVARDKDGYILVDYAALVPVLFEAVKEQQKMIENMNGKIKKLMMTKIDRKESVLN